MLKLEIHSSVGDFVEFMRSSGIVWVSGRDVNGNEATIYLSEELCRKGIEELNAHLVALRLAVPEPSDDIPF